jgi:cytochrome c oxidase cbb3-type subunit 3
MSAAEGNYQLYCINCHGSEGKGDGMLAETLDVPPRNHTDASIMGERTDAFIFKTIAKGGASNGFSENMPAHDTILSKKEIEGLVKYIRKLCNCKGK